MSIELVLLPRVAYRGREVGGPQLRGLLALLAGDLHTGCSTSRLVDGLWPEELPDHPTKAVQILVARARSQLGPELIASTPTGYRLALGEDQVDASALVLSASASVRHARAGDHVAALEHAQTGLALWDGALDDAASTVDGPVAALRAERVSAHRSLVRARALALSRLGRHAEAIEPLTSLVADRPRDEELLLELLRGEAATAGPSAALDRYEAYRSSLREQLGTDPGAALQAQHSRLLQGTAPPVRQGVEHEPNPLLGRDDDVAAVHELLRTSRVTSIVGPGGLGKTRLAHAVSARAEQRVVHVAPLVGVVTDDDVAGEVASSLGVGGSRHVPAGHLGAPTDVLLGIVNALGPGPALLVLDNCEHVLRGAAELVRALVSRSGDLRVLTTSRAPLGLSSESVYHLPELELSVAVELFEQRARAARPSVDLRDSDIVEQLCQCLDGLPLAVELAAARVRTMSIAETARGLDDRFSLLRGGSRDAPERHRTLHAVVEWSWDLLDPAGRAAMRALSVFPGGFTADAARHLLGDPDDDAGFILEQLVEQSLLKVTERPSGTRFSMLEIVREFSSTRREDAGETEDAVDGLLSWARDFGQAHHESPFGPEPAPAVQRIRAEQDNLAQALRHALAREDGAAVAATAAVLGGLWVLESNDPRLAALTEETGRVLSHYRPPPELVEVTRAACGLCVGYTFVTHGPQAVRALVALRRLPPAPPDTLSRAIPVVLGAAPGSAPVDVLCDGDEPLVAAAAGGVVSYSLENEGDLEGALAIARRMLGALDDGRVRWLWAVAHMRVAELCLRLDDAAQALHHLGVALPVVDEIGARVDVAGIRWWLVLANLQLGHIDEAEHWMDRAGPRWAEEPVVAATYGLGVHAEMLLARGDVDAGLELWRRAVGQLAGAEHACAGDDLPGLGQWIPEAEAVAVVAHAQHGRLDLVGEIVSELPDRLWALLDDPGAQPFRTEASICGALLVALGMVGLDGAERRGEERARTRGARMVALAERFRFRGLQPTMSSARVRAAAQQVGGSAYDEAVSSYADLGRDELRMAAQVLLRSALSDFNLSDFNPTS